MQAFASARAWRCVTPYQESYLEPPYHQWWHNVNAQREYTSVPPLCPSKAAMIINSRDCRKRCVPPRSPSRILRNSRLDPVNSRLCPGRTVASQGGRDRAQVWAARRQGRRHACNGNGTRGAATVLPLAHLPPIVPTTPAPLRPYTCFQLSTCFTRSISHAFCDFTTLLPPHTRCFCHHRASPESGAHGKSDRRSLCRSQAAYRRRTHGFWPCWRD